MRYTLIFRTGGTDNFHWRRSLVSSYRRFEVEQAQREVAKRGFVSAIVDQEVLESNGLPKTYEIGDCE